MQMEIFPAIDLRAGKVVRLAQGDYARQTTYSDSPAAVAAGFAQAGCRWIHVVDLDGALKGVPVNLSAVADIAAGAEVKLQFGGGIRTDQAIRDALAAGADRVIIGSAALENWAWFADLLSRNELAGRIALALDGRAGKLATHGWTEQTESTAVELAARVAGSSLSAIIYTDIARDGMLVGPNLSVTAELIAGTDIGVIASGGVSCIDDIVECRRIGCAGVIIGRAYYEGKIDLRTALAAAEDGCQ
ncbi:MAG: 1-(5-phosphoribosyl)-5-[(5-phosphoribosylamino)methylideneamino]imidazole-4-carboxamide isomerase [Planctomycetes bacterium]|nr:1-(5-phosphoribosyl)-5-[(5-phosphoribosylamino)methylideneamino]imidazole-4-carboxamide isomerase [Planctomycetota bacterium]